MEWTKEKPSKPGWYWWRYYRHSRPGFTEVRQIKGDLYAWTFELGYEEVRKWNGEWAGPIPEPTERTEGT